MGLNVNNNNQIVTTVPNELKTLLRTVMLAFYGFEFYLCTDYIMMYSCIAENDLADLLNLDLKVVHQYLLGLKRGKFLSEKLRIEVTSDGKHVKQSYFYINYKMAVNVIKYKLDKIRIRIEAEEKESIRGYYKCSNCPKTFSELDLRELFIGIKCPRCNGEIKEDTTRSYRNLLNIFNSQMSIIFKLLRKVERVRLAESITRPKEIDLKLELIKICSESENQNDNVLISTRKDSKIEIDKINFKEPNQSNEINNDKEIEIVGKLLKYESKNPEIKAKTKTFQIDKGV